jgi:hypothetical protein
MDEAYLAWRCAGFFTPTNVCATVFANGGISFS